MLNFVYGEVNVKKNMKFIISNSPQFSAEEDIYEPSS